MLPPKKPTKATTTAPKAVATTTKTTAGGNVNTGITTAVPASAGSTILPSAKVISGVFDGGMVKNDRNPKYVKSKLKRARPMLCSSLKQVLRSKMF
ncbi:hypothetical protein TWF694_003543 [Orbilia ellipsospora]|uniref:Uncharacterized protein n=1 Tax=Orbilia ellipsospora TaxID=2528407 RepID=A0AAV9WYF3_9PEZI